MFVVFRFIRYTLTLTILINIALGHAWALTTAMVLLIFFTEMVGRTLAKVEFEHHVILAHLQELKTLIEEHQRAVGKPS